MTELEKKAEERANNFLIDLCAYCRECDKKECSHTKDAIFGYKEGYKKGYEQGQNDGYRKATERAYERQQDLTDTYIKDGKKIKQLEKEISELSNSVIELTNSKTELKKQIEKIKKVISCDNCKHNYEHVINMCPYYNCNLEKWELAE